jgi:hypothetical protein
VTFIVSASKGEDVTVTVRLSVVVAIAKAQAFLEEGWQVFITGPTVSATIPATSTNCYCSAPRFGLQSELTFPYSQPRVKQAPTDRTQDGVGCSHVTAAHSRSINDTKIIYFRRQDAYLAQKRSACLAISHSKNQHLRLRGSELDAHRDGTSRSLYFFRLENARPHLRDGVLPKQSVQETLSAPGKCGSPPPRRTIPLAIYAAPIN